MTFYKITNEKENHRGFQYHTGLNILKDPFNKNKNNTCVSGGLYFTDAKNIFRFIEYGIYLREITLPIDNPNFMMVKDPAGNKWRANMVILGKRYELANVETFRMLIELGAKINTKNNIAFRWALKNNHLDIIKLLGANITSEIFNNAIMNGNLSIVQYLLDNKIGAHVNDNAIVYASANGHLEIIKKLIDIGADFRIHNDFAFRLACEFGHDAVVDFLLQQGANINAVNDYALCSASEYGRLDAVKILMQHGANIHMNNDLAFRLACKSGCVKTMELLLLNGADISANNNEALQWAIYSNNKEKVNFLLQNGADISVISADDKKLCYVTINKFRKIAETMQYKKFNEFEKKIYDDVRFYFYTSKRQYKVKYIA